MPSAVCGWCGVHSNMSFKIIEASRFPDDDIGALFGLYQCDACTNCSMASAEVALSEAYHNVDMNGQIDFATVLSWYHEQGRATWHPAIGDALDLQHTPDKIADAARESQACLNAGHRRAAVQLARSVVEATAKEKGITNGTIKQKIDGMFDQRLIREYIRDGAHEVRFLGNEMAHGDFTEPVSADDATLVLALMQELLIEVYESPGRVQEAKDRRAVRGRSTHSGSG